MKRLDKAKKLLARNKQLVLGIAIGIAVMLPTGIYVSEQNNNRATELSNTNEIQQTTNNTKPQELQPVAEQPTNTSTEQPRSTSTPKPSSTPTYTYKPPVCTKEPIPYKTYTRYVNYLEYGVKELSLQGKDGFRETCVDGNTGIRQRSLDATLNPQPAIYDIGRGQTPLTYAEKQANYETCKMSLIEGLNSPSSCDHHLQ